MWKEGGREAERKTYRPMQKKEEQSMNQIPSQFIKKDKEQCMNSILSQIISGFPLLVFAVLAFPISRLKKAHNLELSRRVPFFSSLLRSFSFFR